MSWCLMKCETFVSAALQNYSDFQTLLPSSLHIIWWASLMFLFRSQQWVEFIKLHAKETPAYSLQCLSLHIYIHIHAEQRLEGINGTSLSRSWRFVMYIIVTYEINFVVVWKLKYGDLSHPRYQNKNQIRVCYLFILTIYTRGNILLFRRKPSYRYFHTSFELVQQYKIDPARLGSDHLPQSQWKSSYTYCVHMGSRWK